MNILALQKKLERNVTLLAVGALIAVVIGSLIMAYNVWRTVRGDEPVDIAEQPRIAAAPALRAAPAE